MVSGDVDPDTFVLSRSWENEIKILDKTKGSKEKKLEMKGDVLKETSNTMDEFSLNDKQLIQLGKVGVFIEDVFGNHRDVEWAFYKVIFLYLYKLLITFECIRSYNFQINPAKYIFFKILGFRLGLGYIFESNIRVTFIFFPILPLIIFNFRKALLISFYLLKNLL